MNALLCSNVDNKRADSARVNENGVIVVEANSNDCSSDHEGGSYSCTATADGSSVVVHTRFQAGDDPDDMCAPPRRATCSVIVEPGTYTLSYRGAEHPLELPGGEPVCLPSGDAPTDSGWR